VIMPWRGRVYCLPGVAMEERRDEVLAVVALALATVLFAGQGVLVALAAVAPLASKAYDLASEDPDVETPLDEAGPARPWWAYSLAMVAAGAGLGLWALVRLQRGTSVRGRWTWALVMAGVAALSGVFTWRLLLALAS